MAEVSFLPVVLNLGFYPYKTRCVTCGADTYALDLPRDGVECIECVAKHDQARAIDIMAEHIRRAVAEGHADKVKQIMGEEQFNAYMELLGLSGEVKPFPPREHRSVGARGASSNR
jgi:hypothetical protein